MKRIVKIFIIALFIMYLITFINRNNYYESNQVLSDNAIRNFEEDLRKEKKIIIYLKKRIIIIKYLFFFLIYLILLKKL